MFLHPLRNMTMRHFARKLSMWLLLPGLLLLSAAAQAHLMPAQQGTVNIVGNVLFTAISLPVNALGGIDDDADGRLSQRELQQHQNTIKQQLAQRLQLRDGQQPAQNDFLQLMLEADERAPNNPAGSRNFLLLQKSHFNAPPQALTISTDLFGKQASERQLTIKASRGSEIEAIVLSPLRPSHGFFRSVWQVLADYLRLGVEHILLGPDHLLFLLTILIAAAGWRYWASVLTSFTVAHSITLTAAMLGWLRINPGLVEPLIAASIVLMAVLNLRQRHPQLWQHTAIVFACGLLHGMGFATSISDMGLHGKYQLTSLLGFNLGIELGQTVFLLALLSLGRGLRWLGPQLPAVAPQRFRQSASVLATFVGGCWLLERLGTWA